MEEGSYAVKRSTRCEALKPTHSTMVRPCKTAKRGTRCEALKPLARACAAVSEIAVTTYCGSDLAA